MSASQTLTTKADGSLRTSTPRNGSVVPPESDEIRKEIQDTLSRTRKVLQSNYVRDGSPSVSSSGSPSISAVTISPPPPDRCIFFEPRADGAH